MVLQGGQFVLASGEVFGMKSSMRSLHEMRGAKALHSRRQRMMPLFLTLMSIKSFGYSHYWSKWYFSHPVLRVISFASVYSLRK
ncbi:hypothetical protein BTM36_18280 [Herbaspirillum sp. VT-16-41]|nr:hypothetical protein BTM36_18280 [Herbaspirillum sp. VT-16-41]